MQRKLRAVYMRGGSSKGLFFHENHLPQDPFIRDQVILAAYGSPDPNKRQIDGMGGATSVTSKVAIIGPSEKPGNDVNYTFGQISIDRPLIDYKGNCGNIASAVGPFAIEEGLVQAVEPFTTVKIFQVNTGKEIVAIVSVENGQPKYDGDYSIDGVPGTGGKITLQFLNPSGALTGKLLPTGNVKDTIEVPGSGKFIVSIVDAANPIVFVPAEQLGLTGCEINEIDSNEEVRAILEKVRAQTAVMIGLVSSPEEATAKSQVVPKIAFISKPKDYKTISGREVSASEIDLVARIMSMGTLHKTYAVTGAICTCGSAMIEGTVVNEIVSKKALATKEIRLGHPGGILPVEPNITRKGDIYQYRDATVARTARRLMEGYVYIPERYFNK